jgi:hypothetical protein
MLRIEFPTQFIVEKAKEYEAVVGAPEDHQGIVNFEDEWLDMGGDWYVGLIHHLPRCPCFAITPCVAVSPRVIEHAVCASSEEMYLIAVDEGMR